MELNAYTSYEIENKIDTRPISVWDYDSEEPSGKHSFWDGIIYFSTSIVEIP